MSQSTRERWCQTRFNTSQNDFEFIVLLKLTTNVHSRDLKFIFWDSSEFHWRCFAIFSWYLISTEQQWIFDPFLSKRSGQNQFRRSYMGRYILTISLLSKSYLVHRIFECFHIELGTAVSCYPEFESFGDRSWWARVVVADNTSICASIPISAFMIDVFPWATQRDECVWRRAICPPNVFTLWEQLGFCIPEVNHNISRVWQ